MSWKIKKINIENFKYFHHPFILDVDSKNLLIYGENGSGKSSIYWALYTFFQSRLKSDSASVEKYFDPNSGENLRNKYSKISDDSKVEVIFGDKDDSTAKEKTYVIKCGNVTTQDANDTFLKLSVASSDFLNYKMLSKLTDKENSVENDVTDLFIKEIYPFVDFDRDYVKLDGNRSGIRNALLWHEYIQNSIKDVERQGGKRSAHFNKNGQKYKKFKMLIADFRNELGNFLYDLNQRATKILKDEFGIKDIEVLFETDKEYKFDMPIASEKNRDHMLHKLHIRLKAKLVNAQLVDGKADIVHLRTFFNEAKLTCLGLAVRLSVVDKKYITGGNFAAVLCMDDLMVSLDMGYRVPVTKKLLKYAGSYQLCIFTHDRSLYNMIQDEIKELGYRNDDWSFLEFYKSDPVNEALQEPSVNMVEAKSTKDKVKLYIDNGDYPAAGNYLRKYAEELIKGILPQNFTFKFGKNGEVKNLMLKELYDKTKNKEFCGLYDVQSTIMPDISKYLSRLMNPLSHDDKDVPIYRRELEDALAEVEKYEPIRTGKHVIVARNEADNRKFKIKMSNIEVEFTPVEQWDYIKFPKVGKKYKDCEVKIVNSSGGNYIVDSKLSIKKLYENIKNQVLGTTGGGYMAFDEAIIDVSTNKELRYL